MTRDDQGTAITHATLTDWPRCPECGELIALMPNGTWDHSPCCVCDCPPGWRHQPDCVEVSG